MFVITQNNISKNIQVIKKYNSQNYDLKNTDEIMLYYKNEIEEKINASVKNIDEYRYIIQLKHNSILMNVFDRLKRILNSEIEFSDLKKEDVDKLVDEIKEINKILYENQ